MSEDPAVLRKEKTVTSPLALAVAAFEQAIQTEQTTQPTLLTILSLSGQPQTSQAVTDLDNACGSYSHLDPAQGSGGEEARKATERHYAQASEQAAITEGMIAILHNAVDAEARQNPLQRSIPGTPESRPVCFGCRTFRSIVHFAELVRLALPNYQAASQKFLASRLKPFVETLPEPVQTTFNASLNGQSATGAIALLDTALGINATSHNTELMPLFQEALSVRVAEALSRFKIIGQLEKPEIIELMQGQLTQLIRSIEIDILKYSKYLKPPIKNAVSTLLNEIKPKTTIHAVAA